MIYRKVLYNNNQFPVSLGKQCAYFIICYNWIEEKKKNQVMLAESWNANICKCVEDTESHEQIFIVEYSKPS